MHAEQKKALLEIQALEFTALELNLYLDTHPHDQKALNDYNAAVQQITRLKKDYESRYGPLTNFGYASSRHPWEWIKDPWPWEINY
ncbi:MAG: spore coat protein CotJB [Syntrophomonadaceae bacterium]|nr:spore coat protein CotJB [Syntrophomonadaceae bacterium]